MKEMAVWLKEGVYIIDASVNPVSIFRQFRRKRRIRRIEEFFSGRSRSYKTFSAMKEEVEKLVGLGALPDLPIEGGGEIMSNSKDRIQYNGADFVCPYASEIAGRFVTHIDGLGVCLRDLGSTVSCNASCSIWIGGCEIYLNIGFEPLVKILV